MTANPYRRLWRDLRLLRIAGALPVAAIPLAIAMMLTAIVLFDDQSGSKTSFADLPLIYALAFILTVICGGIHLGLARIQGFATRRQCLVWGVLTSFLLEAGFFAVVLGPPSAFWVPGLQTAGVLGGLVFFPAGLLSGWVYWGLGIRPGPRSDMSAESPPSAPSSLDRVESWERVFAGIMVAAVLTAAPMVVSVMQGGAADLLRRLVMVCLGAIGIWLIGGTAYVWLRRGNRRLLECLALGLMLGLLVPVASIAVSALIQRAMSADAMSFSATFEGVGFGPLARMGVIELPFGLAGGWLFGRMAGLSTTSGMSHSDPTFFRRWRDLNKWRLIGALILAGGAPPILLGTVSTLAFGPPPDQFFTVPALGSALLTFEIWFLALSLAHLFVISRRRDSIHRRDCFLLGAIPFGLFPTLLPMMRFGFGQGTGAKEGLAYIFSYIVVGAITLTPFGLLSGWIFWRVGVRPARPKDLTDAPVFD